MLISEGNLHEKNERPGIDKLITESHFFKDGGIFQLPPVNSFSLFGFLQKNGRLPMGNLKNRKKSS